jgi:hypothetical protein
MSFSHTLFPKLISNDILSFSLIIFSVYVDSVTLKHTIKLTQSQPNAGKNYVILKTVLGSMEGFHLIDEKT